MPVDIVLNEDAKILATELSFDMIRNLVAAALIRKYPAKPGQDFLVAGAAWVQNIYPDRVIFTRDGKTFQCSYKITKQDVELGDDEKEVVDTYVAATDPRVDPMLMSEVKDGLVRIALALTGNYEKDGRKFTISDSDLKQMRDNLTRREVAIDYEHLSANPDAPPGHTRASAWLKAPDRVEAFGDGKKILWGWAEFTPACLAAIRAKEFRYFSPEIHWKDLDEQGNSIGTRLAAGAITNRPFLKDLPPIEIGAKDFPALLEAVALSESKRLTTDVGVVHVPADINSKMKGNDQMPKQFKMKKLAGDDKGKTGIFDGDEMIGMVSAAELAELAEAEFSSTKKALEDKIAKMTVDSECDQEELRKLKASGGKAAEELQSLKAKTAKGGDLYIKHDGDDEDGAALTRLTELVRQTNAHKTDFACLTEFAKETDPDKSELLAEDLLVRGKLTTAGFLRHQRIEKLVDTAVRKGKITPKLRQPMYELAISNFENVQALLGEMKPMVDLKEHGLQGTEDGLTATQEIDARIKQYLTENKDSNYADALKFVARKDPALYERHKESSAVRISDREVAAR